MRTGERYGANNLADFNSKNPEDCFVVIMDEIPYNKSGKVKKNKSYKKL